MEQISENHYSIRDVRRDLDSHSVSGASREPIVHMQRHLNAQCNADEKLKMQV